MVGVLWVLSVFPFFLKGIDAITQSVTGSSAFTTPGSIPIALSFFHTTFNILNVILQIWFVKYLVTLVQKLVPEREDEEEFKLKHIKFGLLNTSELSLLQAKKEIMVYAQQTKKLFSRISNMLNETSERKLVKQFNKVEMGEDKSDDMEVSIASYLTKVSEGELSKQSSKSISSMLRIVDEIESIGDSCLNVARAILRISDKKEKLKPKMKEKIEEMISLVEKAMDIMIENLNKESNEVTKLDAESIEKQINRLRDKLRKEHVTNIEGEKYSYQIGTLYKDIFSGLERTGDHIYDITLSIIDYADA